MNPALRRHRGADPAAPAPQRAPEGLGSEERVKRSAFKRALVWLKIFASNLDRSRTTGVACEMAFWLFTALLPLAAVAGLVVARFASKDANVSAQMFATLPPATRDLLGQELGKVSAWNGGAVAPVAALTFVWLASSGVHSVFDGLELASESKPRPWWKKRLLAIGACVLLSVGIFAIALLSTGLHWVEKFAGKAIPVAHSLSAPFAVVLRLCIAAVIAIALVTGLYAIGLPKAARKRMPILPGAIVAVVLDGLLGYGYGFYLQRAGTGGAYQGALAVIGITLMGLYLLCIALLVGVEVNQLLGTRRLLEQSVHPPVIAPPPLTATMVDCERDVAKEAIAREHRGSLRPSLAGGA